jgi:ribosomal subunit interface protein
MQFHFTARKFKAHPTLRDQASDAVMRLPKIYDGIVRGDVILGYERSANSVKWAEVTIHVHGSVLTATEKSEDFAKSIELAIAKLERRLSKYKSKVRLKDKKTLRKVKEDQVAEDHGE